MRSNQPRTLRAQAFAEVIWNLVRSALFCLLWSVSPAGGAGDTTWWSLQPLAVHRPPASTDAEWNGSFIDQHLRHAMQQRGLKPGGLESPATWFRRASLVLTGLPPSVDAQTAFTAAYRHDPENAYARAVDRLIASPQFGERFARHWLDIVRFTETHGNEWNYDAAYAWRYRDYIIRAFNEDVPYDQLVREHIAGDLVPSPRWNRAGAFMESPIGTAFYRFGEVNHDSCVQFGVIGYDIVDNQLDTLTKAFQASTVACARCHDHKMDPISTREYHSLLAVLRGTRSVQRTLDAPAVHDPDLATLGSLKPAIRKELQRLWAADIEGLTLERLQRTPAWGREKKPGTDDPLFALSLLQASVTNPLPKAWEDWSREWRTTAETRQRENARRFVTLADFRQGIPEGWHRDGIGLRDGGHVGTSDIALLTEGASVVRTLLPPAVYSFALSDRLNAALRSPLLERTHAKLSLEVLGGRFSLSRIVFNNCQLNYNHQHSIHHDSWSWITLDFPTNTTALLPYLELLTYWDNPKFPDPLGTLGKDVENQRDPYEVHAANPRTWWGIRRAVLHDGPEAPRDELQYLEPLFASPAPSSAEAVMDRFRAVAAKALKAFGSNAATEQDIRWMQWLLDHGLLTNRVTASPLLAERVGEYRQVEQRMPSPTTMPGMADETEGILQPVLARGEPDKPGERVGPGYVAALNPKSPARAFHGSGRAAVADLICDPANPLTARVMVNRVWQWMFGRGLVGTPDDFGRQGELPTHPELLDALAAQFVREGWSMKQLVRSLALTRAFRSTSVASNASSELDPQNLYLAHYSARRAEAEIIRDSILAVSGRLDRRMNGPSISPYREKADPEKRLFTGPLDGAGRRSIYLKFQLMDAPHFTKEFNLPGGKVTQGRRDTTNVPAQSLAMLNDPFVIAMADYWAGRLLSDGVISVEARIAGMFQTALGREATAEELQRFEIAVRSVATTYGVEDKDLLAHRTVWRDAAHMMFNLKEFIFVP